jgi:hypothetical protein
VFYVIAGNWSAVALTTRFGLKDSSKVLDGSVHPPAIVSKVTDIHERVFLNGMAVLNDRKGLVVVGDAGAGVVWCLHLIWEQGGAPKRWMIRL